MQIMRVVLGETCTRFLSGPDGGRDGWFHGQASGRLLSENNLTGKFAVQCKHTSVQHDLLDLVGVKKEVEKVKRLATTNLNYVLMTNRPVSAQSEKHIREAFEMTGVVGRCIILSESWIEDTIDAHSRLLRLVPRLYGIGDLSQILSSVIEQQTVALLQDLAHALRAFVPTESYRRAERALHDHGFVVLVGPPASGKSAIASNLCMVSTAQEADVRALRIEHADQFKSTWSPSDNKTIYWVDDVFGETTLDESRLREWSTALEKVDSARRRGARIIFCTRDYILAAAERWLKKSKSAFINDARVKVNVTNLSRDEREAILYNYIKDGDIGRGKKRALKPHLAKIARSASFSPELARRLGLQRFNEGVRYSERGYDWDDLRGFFDRPVEHFRDIIHGLSGSETAALAVCLLSGNSVPDPIPDDTLAEAVLRTYGVSMQKVREAFELLEGSLVKRIRTKNAQNWQLHHPTMIEALQNELSSKSSQLLLYLQSARLDAILRDTTTAQPRPQSRQVFVPVSAYGHLMSRLVSADDASVDSLANYLCESASDEFLRAIDDLSAATVDRALSILPEPEGFDTSVYLAVRLNEVGRFDDVRRRQLTSLLAKSLYMTGWTGFLDVAGIGAILSEFTTAFLEDELEKDFPSVERLCDWYSQDLSSTQHIDDAIGALESHVGRLVIALEMTGLTSSDSEERLRYRLSLSQKHLDETREKIEEQEELRADRDFQEWKDTRGEDRHEHDQGRFSDVDE